MQKSKLEYTNDDTVVLRLRVRLLAKKYTELLREAADESCSSKQPVQSSKAVPCRAVPCRAVLHYFIRITSSVT